MKKKRIITDGGVNGSGVGVINVNSKEFKALQSKIKERSKKQSKKQLLENDFLSLRLQMESYLEKDSNTIVEVGWFLKEFINVLGIKNKLFAEYLGFKESNLSALLKGKRKINVDLALKLGNIFNVDSSLWIYVQSKNELIRMEEENKNEYKKYSIDDLLKQAS